MFLARRAVLPPLLLMAASGGCALIVGSVDGTRSFDAGAHEAEAGAHDATTHDARGRADAHPASDANLKDGGRDDASCPATAAFCDNFDEYARGADANVLNGHWSDGLTVTDGAIATISQEASVSPPSSLHLTIAGSPSSVHVLETFTAPPQFSRLICSFDMDVDTADGAGVIFLANLTQAAGSQKSLITLFNGGNVAAEPEFADAPAYVMGGVSNVPTGGWYHYALTFLQAPPDGGGDQMTETVTWSSHEVEAGIPVFVPSVIGTVQVGLSIGPVNDAGPINAYFDNFECSFDGM